MRQPWDLDPETKRGVIDWAVKGLFARLFVAVVLFVSAGRLDWVWGWVYALIYLAFDIATALVVLPRSPHLLIERADIQEGTKSWDKVIVRAAAGYLPIASWIISGLDVRNGWTGPVMLWFHIAAALIVVIGYALVVWAMGANAFFSLAVRIQKERNHRVVTSGPYRFVRHPGYVGAILFTVLAPVMLGSWWALIPAGLSAVLYVVRTALEDRTLYEELPGYAEYTRQARYRLLPGVW